MGRSRYDLWAIGEWCNWQHGSFWFCNLGFESLFPSHPTPVG